MNDIMIDFETLGNGKNACVVQVGACYFDRTTGEIGRTLGFNIDAHSAMRSGAEMDASTVYWWLSQSKEAQESITRGPLLHIDDAMNTLNDFLEGAKGIWSHATFDFVILTETLKRLNIKPKFGYRAARDLRTLVDLAKITMSKFPREGVHHNGLDDAKFQVKYTVAALNKLAGKIEKS